MRGDGVRPDDDGHADFCRVLIAVIIITGCKFAERNWEASIVRGG